jgi:hypothetical protein|tara:strand:- start:2788 stop:3114 length:327 start_codon:yes stop_codon:yes gene_type:complete
MTIAVWIEEQKDKIQEVDIDVDSTDTFRLLKGPGTFIGQWPEIEVVIMKCRESCMELMDNENVLPAPFDKEDTKGSVLLIRMDEDSEPQDFTLTEYRRFCQTPPHSTS